MLPMPQRIKMKAPPTNTMEKNLDVDTHGLRIKYYLRSFDNLKLMLPRDARCKCKLTSSLRDHSSRLRCSTVHTCLGRILIFSNSGRQLQLIRAKIMAEVSWGTLATVV